MVRLPGFEPGSSTWQAEVLNQARLQPHAWSFNTLIQRGDVSWPLCWSRVPVTGLNQHGFCLFKFSEKANSLFIHYPVETVFKQRFGFCLGFCFPDDVAFSPVLVVLAKLSVEQNVSEAFVSEQLTENKTLGAGARAGESRR
jgi:hypothetical protein